MRILLVAERRAAQHFELLASKLGWNLTCVPDATEAVAFTEKTEFQAIIVQVAQAEVASCLAVISNLSNTRKVPPIIACMHSDSLTNRLRALELGAVTYAQWSDDLRELDLTIRSLIRLTKAQNSPVITIQGISLDLRAKAFSIDQVTIPFTMLEYQLLELLFLNKGRLLSREQIMNHLYDYEDEPEQKIIDVLICKIRQRMRRAGGYPGIVETVWGGGYRISNWGSKKQLRLELTERAA